MPKVSQLNSLYPRGHVKTPSLM